MSKITEESIENCFFDYIRSLDNPDEIVNRDLEKYLSHNLFGNNSFYTNGWSIYVNFKHFINGSKGIEISVIYFKDEKEGEYHLFYAYDDIVHDILYKKRIDTINELLGDFD